MEIELREASDQYIYTIVIGFTILLQLFNRFAFYQEYSSFTQHRNYKSFNNVFVFLSAGISYILITALLLFPLLQTELRYYVSNDWSAFFFIALCLLILETAKFVITGVWYMSYKSYDLFIENLSHKSFVGWVKYLLTLLFLVAFVYSPLKDYYSDSYAILLFVGLYILDIFFEYLTIEKYHALSIFTKFLYLCTLEILPVLVFVKLILNFEQ